MERSRELACECHFRPLAWPPSWLPQEGALANDFPAGDEEVRFSMSRYGRYRRFAALAACVGSTTAIAALAGAGPAMATVKCVESPVYGSGSSFQNTAQGVFKTGWATHTSCEKGVPISTYSATSSGEGLEVFGFGNAAGVNKEVLQPGKDTVAELAREGKGANPCTALDIAGKCLDLFVGTDDAPSTEQLKFGTTASGGKSNTLAGEKGHRGDVVIPVAQGPIAAIISLPAGCKILAGSKLNLTNEAFNEVFAGKGNGKPENWAKLLEKLGYSKVASEGELAANKYFETPTAPEASLPRFEAGGKEEVVVHSKSEIEKNENPGGKKETISEQTKKTVKGEGCTQSIKAQVRSSESGTSYATKAYFNQINEAVWKNFVSDAAEGIHGWPEEAEVVKENLETSGKGLNTPNKKGSQLAEDTAANPGSIGYADTADAFKGGGATGEATVIQKGSGPESLKEVVQEGEAENLTTKTKEKILTLKASPGKSISHQILWAQVQNNGIKPLGEKGTGAVFASPLTVATEKTTHQANCEPSVTIKGDEKFPHHWNESWFGTLTSDPNAFETGSLKTDYPACAITYDVAQHHYRNSNLYGNSSKVPTKLAEEMANTAKDYFEYVTSQGPTDLTNSGFYIGPPTAMSKYIHNAVLNIGA
jgi:hypothetical protein